jgi:hypothetical protein
MRPKFLTTTAPSTFGDTVDIVLTLGLLLAVIPVGIVLALATAVPSNDIAPHDIDDETA